MDIRLQQKISPSDAYERQCAVVPQPGKFRSGEETIETHKFGPLKVLTTSTGASIHIGPEGAATTRIVVDAKPVQGEPSIGVEGQSVDVPSAISTLEQAKR